MLSAPIDLQRVRQLFSDPKKIEGSDFLRREIASRMFEKLELVKIMPRHILDAGCGEGADVIQLQKRFADAELFGVDAGLAMLKQAQAKQIAAKGAVQRLLHKWVPAGLGSVTTQKWLNADFAQLPLAHQSMDLVWSNMALHWHPQPDVIFAEWRRVLRTEGLLMFSCFGPDTLIELKQAFSQVDAFPHALPFVDMHDFGDMLVNAGFSTPVMDMEKITLTYQTVEQLFADVRAFGGNPLLTRAKGLLGRAKYQQLVEHLESRRGQDGRIALSFEIIYGHAFKPIPRKLATGESIIRLDFPKK